MRPVRLFRHGLQVFYFRDKCVVDGSANFRAIMRSKSVHLGWEQKIVCQLLKSVVANDLISWRMMKFQKNMGRERENMEQEGEKVA